MSSNLSIFYLMVFFVFGSTTNKDFIYKYIDEYSATAIEEMERSNIPASIKLAQGMLESNWGRSKLAVTANNHFGVKCGSQWEGGTYDLFDDEYDKNGNHKKSCFRSYRSAKTSYRAHTDFLMDPKKEYRYGLLFDIPRTDYKSWAYGLLRSGYATDKKYAEKLIQIIEDYQLHIFDDPIIIRNGELVYLDKEEPTKRRSSISTETEMITEQVEESTPPPAFTLKETENQFDTRFRKQRYGDIHFVKEGESMEAIAAAYEVNLTNLYIKNRMPTGTQPMVGEKIQITGFIRMGKRPKYFDPAKSADSEFVF